MMSEAAEGAVWCSPERVAALREYYDTTDQSMMIDRAVLETDVATDPMVTTSLRLPKSLLDWVRDQAEEQDMKPTALIRRWVEERRRALAADPTVEDRVTTLERRVDELSGARGCDE